MYPRLAQFGSVSIPTYGVVAAIGLILAILFAEWCARPAGVSPEKMYSLCIVTVVGTIVLSRFVLIVESPQTLRDYPLLLLSLPTLTKFGLALAAASALGSIGVQRMPLLRTLDALAPAALLFAAFLHLGSFFAGTDLGSRAALAIGNLVPGDEGHHPVALYAAGMSAIAAAVSTLVLRRRMGTGLAFGVALTLGAAGRFFADEFRPSYLMPQAVVPGFLRVDQLVLILLTASGMMFFFDWRRRNAQ